MTEAEARSVIKNCITKVVTNSEVQSSGAVYCTDDRDQTSYIFTSQALGWLEAEIKETFPFANIAPLRFGSARTIPVKEVLERTWIYNKRVFAELPRPRQ